MKIQQNGKYQYLQLFAFRPKNQQNRVKRIFKSSFDNQKITNNNVIIYLEQSAYFQFRNIKIWVENLFFPNFSRHYSLIPHNALKNLPGNTFVKFFF